MKLQINEYINYLYNNINCIERGKYEGGPLTIMSLQNININDRAVISHNKVIQI